MNRTLEQFLPRSTLPVEQAPRKPPCFLLIKAIKQLYYKSRSIVLIDFLDCKG